MSPLMNDDQHDVQVDPYDNTVVTVAGLLVPTMDYLAGNGAQGASANDMTGVVGQNASSSTSTNTNVFDVSTYDPLQAHIEQLAASAGMTPHLTAPCQYEIQQAQPKQQSQEQQQPQQQQYYFVPLQQGFANVGPFSTPMAMAYPTVSQPGASVDTGISSTQPQQYLGAPLATAPIAPLTPKLFHPVQVIPTYASAPAAGKRPHPRSKQKANKKQEMGHYPSHSSVASASTIASNAFFDNDEPLEKKLPSNWVTMTPEEQRRWERNAREQQRSHKIAEQIRELQNVLAESHVKFKPNKHSILLSVVDYIKQLQSRAIMLDAEHHKLIQTIRQTTEMVNSGQAPESEAPLTNEEQAEMLFVQGLDYQSIFDQGTAALGIAALDGRIIACNQEFVNLLGFSRDVLLQQSVFSVMQNHEEVFKVMAEMLKAETFNDGLGDIDEQEKKPLYWTGVVSQTDQNVSVV